MRSKTLVAVLSIAALAPVGTAQADPIQVTSGFLVTGATESSAAFSLTGAGNRIDGRWPGTALPCQSCTAGGLVTPDARFLYDTVPFVWGDPFASGTATVGGVTYPALYFSGSLAFSGSPFRLPEVSGPGDAVFVFEQPFSFTGTVSGFDRLLEGPREIYPLFTTTWMGSGTAELRFLGVNISGRSFYTYLGSTYEFAEPVPEPATVLLCATGVAMLIRRRHETRHQRG